jgi:MFS family permease
VRSPPQLPDREAAEALRLLGVHVDPLDQRTLRAFPRERTEAHDRVFVPLKDGLDRALRSVARPARHPVALGEGSQRVAEEHTLNAPVDDQPAPDHGDRLRALSEPAPPIRRNTILLAASLAANSAMLQLSAAVATLTVVLVVGVKGLVGLGPAIVLGTGALFALPAGRAMDRFGRIPVLVAGFALGIVGGVLAAVGAGLDLAVPVLVGLVCVGAASATALLARTAAGDMYPPSRRARGISYVLFGAVFGAILGPAVFSPLLADRELDADALVLPWIAAAGFMVLGLVLVAAVRPDPRRIARMIGAPERGEVVGVAAPLAEILRRPGVLPALLAALASFAVMVGIMTLTGVVVVEQGHPARVVFPIIGAHVIGMYALVIVVGGLIDRIGRTRALVGGLLVMAVSAVSLLWVTSVGAFAFTLFALGLGWSFSFVAATAQLADATAPAERGRLLGFNDLLAGLTGAGLSLLGGYALHAIGVAALGVGGLLLVLAPAGWIVRYSLRLRALGLAPSRAD